MKPAPFNYFRPECLDEALDLLAEHREQARILAGGQSLIPLLNQRLTNCPNLIDTNRIAELSGFTLTKTHLRIGAMTRQSSLENEPLIKQHFPEILELLPFLGFPATRNRGTVGGSIAWADPAGELPALALALDGIVELHSEAGGVRRLTVDEFLTGPYSTRARPDEILVAVELPIGPSPRNRYVREISVRATGRAAAGIVATASENQKRRVTLFGWFDRPRSFDIVVPDAGLNALPEEWLQPLNPTFSDSVWQTDAHGSADYRRFVFGSLVREAARHFDFV